MTIIPDDDVLINFDQLSREVGGHGKPVSRPTIYRAIKAGRLPPPVHPTPGISRWWLSQVRAAIRGAAVGAA